MRSMSNVKHHNEWLGLNVWNYGDSI